MLSSLQYMKQFKSKFVVRINVSSQTFSKIDTIRVTVTIINERHLWRIRTMGFLSGFRCSSSNELFGSFAKGEGWRPNSGWALAQVFCPKS